MGGVAGFALKAERWDVRRRWGLKGWNRELEVHAVIFLWENSHAVLQLIRFSMKFG